MKYAVCLMAFFLLSGVSSWAQSPPEPKQYPDPNRQTWFNNLADKISTLGEEEQDAQKIKQERHKIRRMVRQSANERAKRKDMQLRIQQEQQAILERQ